jgi:calcineurin-like phosphoesterase family protein
MHGRKVLIKGNHDILELKEYIPYFDDIRGIHQFEGMCLTHVPIHPDSLSRWKVNIHGHLHANRVKGKFGQVNDERYQNVSMEQLDDYTPISLEQMRSRLKNLGLM